MKNNRWAALVFISVAVSLIIVDSTIINVAVPSIVDDLSATSTQVQWIQEAYTVVFASLLLLFGGLADRFGRKRLMLLGVTLFAGASVLAAVSPSADLLIAARLVQGVGGAMILPTTLSLINATFSGRERGIAFAVWGSTIGGMAAVGPLLGGWLTTAFSWRWAFGINVPLGLIVFVGALITVSESREQIRRGLDIVGATLSVVLFATLVFGLIEGRTYGWWTGGDDFSIGSWTWPFALSPVPVAFGISLAALVGFVLWSFHRERNGKPALLGLSLFRITSFRNGNVVAMTVALGEFGLILSLPLWLQFALSFDALQVGFLLLALAAGSFVASGFAGAFSGKLKAVTIVRTGLALELLGVLATAIIVRPDAQWGWLIPSLFVYGLGVGLATAQLTGVVLQDVPVESSGQASGTQSTARQVGSALGVAILGTVLFSTTASALSASLAADQVPAQQADSIVNTVVDSAGAAIAGLQSQPGMSAIAADAVAALSTGTSAAAFTAAGFLALGLVASISLGRPSRTHVESSRGAVVPDGRRARRGSGS